MRFESERAKFEAIGMHAMIPKPRSDEGSP
ncbi:hypothetical protein FP2506_14819 [Fulvimarina pelagi HTCC2506]|uniref:Uncharacterized protein n=1 Tax=Fulvimarina pelagi HTCC2506 TaxID=314231 RepID=Q0G3W6_9HYPH|nr:hypothetical protein FP2506_14819 [Fulvimarina pelagi HTCC2506]